MLNTPEVGIKMRGQWPHAKPFEKIGINECLHLPKLTIPRASDYAESFCRLWLVEALPPSAFGIVRDSA